MEGHLKRLVKKREEKFLLHLTTLFRKEASAQVEVCDVETVSRVGREATLPMLDIEALVERISENQKVLEDGRKAELLDLIETLNERNFIKGQEAKEERHKKKMEYKGKEKEKSREAKWKTRIEKHKEREAKKEAKIAQRQKDKKMKLEEREKTRKAKQDSLVLKEKAEKKKNEEIFSLLNETSKALKEVKVIESK